MSDHVKSVQGIVLKFADKVYTATNISVTYKKPEIDATSLSIPTGSTSVGRVRFGNLSETEIKVDWLGYQKPPTYGPQKLELVTTSIHSSMMTSVAYPLGVNTSNQAIAYGVSITASTGDLMKGTATFKLV